MKFNEFLNEYKEVEILEIEKNENSILVSCKAEHKLEECPICGSKNIIRNGFCIKKIKDIPYEGKSVTVNIKRQRWVCNDCKSSSLSVVPFMYSQFLITNRLMDYIIKASQNLTYQEVANNVLMERRTVNKICKNYFSTQSVNRIKESFGIIPFTYKNTNKYLVINPYQKTIYSLLDANEKSINVYFESMSKQAKQNIKHILLPPNIDLINTIKAKFPQAQLNLERKSFIEEVDNALHKLLEKYLKNSYIPLTWIEKIDGIFYKCWYSLSKDEEERLKELKKIDEYCYILCEVRNELLCVNNKVSSLSSRISSTISSITSKYMSLINDYEEYKKDLVELKHELEIIAEITDEIVEIDEEIYKHINKFDSFMREQTHLISPTTIVEKFNSLNDENQD